MKQEILKSIFEKINAYSLHEAVRSRLMEQVGDVIITTIIMLVSLPFQVLIYLIIKLTDPGPAIYLHECYGRG